MIIKSAVEPIRDGVFHGAPPHKPIFKSSVNSSRENDFKKQI